MKAKKSCEPSTGVDNFSRDRGKSIIPAGVVNLEQVINFVIV